MDFAAQAQCFSLLLSVRQGLDSSSSARMTCGWEIGALRLCEAGLANGSTPGYLQQQH